MKLLLLLLLLLIFPASATSITYSVEPKIILPGGIAECKITITSPTPVKINQISVFGYGVEVQRDQFYVGGYVTSYSFTFTVKALRVGTHYVDVNINLENDSIFQAIPITVDDVFPVISASGSAYEGEINTVRFLISTPVQLRNVKIRPLFESYPKELIFGILEGSAEFYLAFEARDNLVFEISFYNGKSYHLVKRSVEVSILPSKGVIVDLNLTYKTFYMGDSANLYVGLTNLRNDRIYDVQVSLICNCDFDSNKTIAKLDSKEVKNLKFTFSPNEAGNGSLEVQVKFKDEFGKEHYFKRKLEFHVFEEHQLVFTNVRASKTVSGEINNLGRSTTYNVFLEAFCNGKKEEQFLGNLDPADFQMFEFHIICDRILLKASWSNELGKKFEIYKELKFEREVKQGSIAPLLSLAALIFVTVMVVLIAWRIKR